jgi:DUF1009 family protein
MDSQCLDSARQQGGRLTQEAICLFGKQTVEQAKKVGLNDMAIEAELVVEGARQLRQAILIGKGRLSRQWMKRPP